jgi:hypothetical protein
LRKLDEDDKDTLNLIIGMAQTAGTAPQAAEGTLPHLKAEAVNDPVMRAEQAEIDVARVRLKVDQYRQQLDDRWAGVVGVTNAKIEENAQEIDDQDVMTSRFLTHDVGNAMSWQ